MDDTPGASGSAQRPGETHTDEQMAGATHMGLEAFYNEPEPTNEIIGIHDVRSVVSTNAPSGGRMDPRS
eukprot:6053166-Karenia_brevis.AAC.1